MRRFTFRLQSILDVRASQLEERRMELGAIAQECARIEREIAERRAERAHLLSSSRAAGADIASRTAVESFAARLTSECTGLEASLDDARSRRDVATERYTEARRNHDILERLRERREAVHRLDQKRAEQKIADEVAQNRAATRLYR